MSTATKRRIDYGNYGKNALDVSILVTGGARGIGKAIAEAIAEAGSHVAIVDIDIDEAKTADEIAKNLDVQTIAIKTDVTNQEDVDKMIASILNKFGKLDVAFVMQAYA